MFMRLQTPVFSFFISVIILSTAACGHEAVAPAPQPLKVTILEISKNNLPQQLSYSGTIEPDNTAQVGFAVSGIVNNINVQEGQHVNTGQLLASIDATEYSNALAIADAGLEQAEDLYARLDGLYKKGSLPEKDYIDIKTKLAQAKANKSINAKRIADSRLLSPMSGIISSRVIERGSTAAPGVPAFTIIKTDQVYARISVPESEVGSLSNGMDVIVFIPTLSDTVKGRISIINPQADAVSRTYSVKVKLGNASGKLLPGMIAETNIQTRKSVDIIIIPATAVVRDADAIAYVYIATEQNKAIRKRVTTGNLTGNNEVIITEGLTPGDKIIIAGQSRIKDGSSITF